MKYQTNTKTHTNTHTHTQILSPLIYLPLKISHTHITLIQIYEHQVLITQPVVSLEKNIVKHKPMGNSDITSQAHLYFYFYCTTNKQRTFLSLLKWVFLEL